MNPYRTVPDKPIGRRWGATFWVRVASYWKRKQRQKNRQKIDFFKSPSKQAFFVGCDCGSCHSAKIFLTKQEAAKSLQYHINQ